jgi:peroxiredoxin
MMLRFLKDVGRGLIPVALFLTLACSGGELAQDFQVELFEGGKFQLSDEYQDNVVVINFWFPSCAPCREEMPEFERARKELHGEPVRFLGMFVPLGFDSEQSAREFVDDLGLTFNFATDRQSAITSAYGIEFFPTTWFIDQGGTVSSTHTGALDVDRITAEVHKLLND